MGRFELGFEGEAASDPVGDGLEVLEAAIAARSAPSELEQPIDRFDGIGGGVVFEVSKDPIKVPTQGAPEAHEGLQSGEAAPAEDRTKMFVGIFAGLVVPGVDEELPGGVNGTSPRGFTSQIPSQALS